MASLLGTNDARLTAIIGGGQREKAPMTVYFMYFGFVYVVTGGRWLRLIGCTGGAGCGALSRVRRGNPAPIPEPFRADRSPKQRC